jgi:hypothetical protein
MPGAFADPEALVGAGAAPAGEVPTASAPAAKGEAVPKPLRNPKR